MPEEPERTRLFIDHALFTLFAAEEHVRSLQHDVDTYRMLLSQALTELHSQQQLNRRLMYRIEHNRVER